MTSQSKTNLKALAIVDGVVLPAFVETSATKPWKLMPWMKNPVVA